MQTNPSIDIAGIFSNSMHYTSAMTQQDCNKFYRQHISLIDPSIERAIFFCEGGKYKLTVYDEEGKTVWEENKPIIKKEIVNFKEYDWGQYQDKVTIYAIACLPFLLANFKLENPDKEDRAFRKKNLELLQRFKHDKIFMNYFMDTITDDSWGWSLDEDKIDKQIEYYEWTLSGKESKKRANWSNVIQFEYLARYVDIALNSEKDKIDFLWNFFMEFGRDINPTTIKQQMLIASRKNQMMAFSKEHIQKILAQPDNTHTEEYLTNYVVNEIISLF